MVANTDKLKNIKMVVLDLDGTTLQDDGSITEHTTEVFRRIKEKGIIVAVASGRSAIEAKKAADALGADEYMILLTGEKVFDRKAGKNIFLNTLTFEQSLAIASVLQSTDNLYFQIYDEDRLISTPKAIKFIDNASLPLGYSDFAKSIMDLKEDIVDYIHKSSRSGEKYSVLSEDMDLLEEVCEKLRKIPGILVVHPQPQAIEIIPATAHKGVALCALKDHLGLRTEEVMVIGDSENDMQLFEEAGYKIAVGNAMSCLKEKADMIAPPYNEEGAAYAAEKLLLTGFEVE